MKLRIFLMMGILSLLFGCENRAPLGGNYYYNKEKNIIQYRYTQGGALRWYYSDLPTANNKTFKVYSRVYATDKESVFFAGKPVKALVPNGFQVIEEYPNLFAKNTKSKQILYKDSVIDIDYQTAKIHSPNYISDKNKVIFIVKKGVFEHGQFHKVPVTDPASFGEFKKKSRNGMAIAFDHHHIYLDGINTNIPSTKSQVIQLGLPTIILQNDVLHYIYPSYRKKETTFKDLKPPFNVTEHGAIASFIYDTYYHFEVEGLQQANQIESSAWLTDDNGLYFVDDSKIRKVSDRQNTQYQYDENYPKYLKTSDNLIHIQTYPFKVSYYSVTAQIMEDDIVKDNNKVFFKGEEIKNVDIETFTKLPKNAGFIDKNFFYENHLNDKKAIPSWAYQEFLNGKNSNDLFGIDMKYTHTVYHTYWNGFIVAISMPTEQNKSDTISLEFKNIARKTIQLKRPIEEQLYISYKPYSRESPVFYSDGTVTITKEHEYDFSHIKNEESIKFSFPINQQIIEQLTTNVHGQQVLPEFVLSNIEFALERNDYNLYIETSLN